MMKMSSEDREVGGGGAGGVKGKGCEWEGGEDDKASCGRVPPPPSLDLCPNLSIHRRHV